MLWDLVGCRHLTEEELDRYRDGGRGRYWVRVVEEGEKLHMADWDLEDTWVYHTSVYLSVLFLHDAGGWVPRFVRTTREIAKGFADYYGGNIREDE